MKTVYVLLAVAFTYVFGGPIHEFREIKQAVDSVMESLPKTDTTYVMELVHNETRECKYDFFCQVEKVLSGNKDVAQLPNFSKVENLIRRLEAKNKHHVKNCTVKSTGQEIGLHQFMTHVRKYTQICNASPQSKQNN